MPTNHLSIHNLRKLWNEDFLPGKRQEIKIENLELKLSINDLNQRWDTLEQLQDFISKKYDTVIEPYKNSLVRQLSVVDQSNRSMLS